MGDGEAMTDSKVQKERLEAACEGEVMTDELETIRNRLLTNQQAAVQFISERDERISCLLKANASLAHTVKAQAMEIAARNAANIYLREKLADAHERITELMRESAKGAATVAAFVRVTHNEQTSAEERGRQTEEPQSASLDEEMTPQQTGAPRSDKEGGAGYDK